jgi:hypothetical protein
MNADLHDAELVGLNYETDKNIRLTFKTVGARRVDLVLIGIRRFAATNLWDGNTVLDVMSTKFGNLEPERVPEIAKDAFSHEFVAPPSARRDGTRKQWEQWLKQIEAGTLHALVVEPTYGAEIVAICDDLSITDGGD